MFDQDHLRALLSSPLHTLQRTIRDHGISDWITEVIRIDVLETPSNVVVNADLPGVENFKRDIDLSIEHGRLTIKANVVKESETDEESENKPVFVIKERTTGQIVRTIDLPHTVSNNQPKAVYRNGVLTITFTKDPDASRHGVSIPIDE